MSKCKRCEATMPPSIDRGIGVTGTKSLPPSVRRCAACGWDPEAPVLGPKKKDLKPPSVGESFKKGQ